MATRSPRPKLTMRSPVDLAIAAVEDSGRTLDLDSGDADTAPTSLGLPALQETKACSHHHYICARCGKPLRRSPE
jgi:hypothetical protein